MKGLDTLLDQSLIIGRKGYKRVGWGQVKFYPYKKGTWKRFSHAEGEHNLFWSLAQAEGERRERHSLKGGA